MHAPANTLEVTGIFMVGAVAGSLLKYTHHRNLGALCRDLLVNTGPTPNVHPAIVTGGATGGQQASFLAWSTSGKPPCLSEHAQQMVGPHSQDCSDDFLTVLGAPQRDNETGRMLSVKERLEGLQARNG
jgi:hypothetical protein